MLGSCPYQDALAPQVRGGAHVRELPLSGRPCPAGTWRLPMLGSCPYQDALAPQVRGGLPMLGSCPYQDALAPQVRGGCPC